ncbi:serine/threonine-protein kinase [Streptomyces sp. NPDC001744]|uniref:serine/threonine-protein kinase n=1 Tax=Streptomyces sp. NPDC001744 TaxID=3364606 RepID=UPI0036927016
MTVIAGRYRLLDVLAEGATGTVWRALDETDGHEVALKEPRVPPGLPADEVPPLHARREREARTAARISHPCVVRVLGVASENGRPWVVTELVRGLSLAETLEADGPLPRREAARVGAEVLAGLRAAREAGVPHRGVRPDHVLLGNDGRVAVTGFVTGAGAGPDGATDPAADLRSLGTLLEAATDDRSGPLGAVVDALLGAEDSGPATADGIERELRRIAGGGARAADPAGTGAAAPPPGTRENGDDDARGAAGAPAERDGGTPRRSASRRTPVLVAGVVGALLIAGALVYHWVEDDGRGAGPGAPGGVTSTAPAGSGAPGADGGGVTPRP